MTIFLDFIQLYFFLASSTIAICAENCEHRFSQEGLWKEQTLKQRKATSNVLVKNSSVIRCGGLGIIVRSCVLTLVVRSRRTQWPWPEWPRRSRRLLRLLEDSHDPGVTDLFGEPLSGTLDCRSSAVKYERSTSIVAKKWEPGNLVPSRFSGQIRKVEARLGKLAKIRKVETD